MGAICVASATMPIIKRDKIPRTCSSCRDAQDSTRGLIEAILYAGLTSSPGLPSGCSSGLTCRYRRLRLTHSPLRWSSVDGQDALRRQKRVLLATPVAEYRFRHRFSGCVRHCSASRILLATGSGRHQRIHTESAYGDMELTSRTSVGPSRGDSKPMSKHTVSKCGHSVSLLPRMLSQAVQCRGSAIEHFRSRAWIVCTRLVQVG